MDIWEKLNAIDRRWIYLLMFLSVLIPTIFVVKFPIELTPEAEQLYNAVEELPDSSVIMLTFDYYPSALAETEPMSKVFGMPMDNFFPICPGKTPNGWSKKGRLVKACCRRCVLVSGE